MGLLVPKASTWLRVSQGWAGNGYGQFILPRVGMEVLVSFINGDPDRPIITGCLFNGNNQLPYALPEHKTRSTFKTASSPGGENSNELRFEDKAGREEIYLHAAKDYQERIENNSHSHIVNDRQQLIEGQHIFEVRGEHHHTVHGTRHWHAKADDHHTIGGNRHTKIGNKALIEAGQELHYHAGNKIVINADQTLTASGGGSFLKLDASGVTLVGPTVRIIPKGAAKASYDLPILALAESAFSAQYQLFKSDGRNFQGYKYTIHDANNNIIKQGITNELGYTEYVVTEKSEMLSAYKSVMRESERIKENWKENLEEMLNKYLSEGK